MGKAARRHRVVAIPVVVTDPAARTLTGNGFQQRLGICCRSQLLCRQQGDIMPTTTAGSVIRLVEAQRAIEGDGFVVRRPFPTTALSYVDPFLLFDHMGPVVFAPGEGTGTPWHPHRGFETVTYLLEGDLEHRDSLGNHGFLHSGDTQWMTAGSGRAPQGGPVRRGPASRRPHAWSAAMGQPARIVEDDATGLSRPARRRERRREPRG